MESIDLNLFTLACFRMSERLGGQQEKDKCPAISCSPKILLLLCCPRCTRLQCDFSPSKREAGKLRKHLTHLWIMHFKFHALFNPRAWMLPIELLATTVPPANNNQSDTFLSVMISYPWWCQQGDSASFHCAVASLPMGWDSAGVMFLHTNRLSFVRENSPRLCFPV